MSKTKTKTRKAAPSLSQDELDDLAAEVAAILNDGGTHSKEFWKAYIKRQRKQPRPAPRDKADDKATP